MKGNNIFLIAISFALELGFFGCRQQETETPPVCTRLEKVKIRGREPAFTPNYKLQWSNHSVLKVYFIEDKGALDDRIVAIANTWSKYGGISFTRTKKITDSQVRVTLKSGGYASAVGRECVQVEYTDQPTMFLQNLDALKDSVEFTRVVLHEFGHAIGLEHELRKPSAKIPWDTAAVYAFYDSIYHWNKAKVNANIFQPFSVPKEYDEFDSTSIMVYAVPAFLTKNKYSIPWPSGLSVSDTTYIKQWYPK